MMRSLAPESPAAGRRARRVLALVAVVVALSGVTYAFPLLVNEPHASALANVLYVEKDGDYVAWTSPWGSERHHVGAAFTANGTLDRVMLLRKGDLGALLQGEQIHPLQEFPLGRHLGPVTMGTVDFVPPPAECPPPTGGCIDETIPILVWVSGEAWRGATPEEAKVSETWHELGLQRTASSGTTGPVGYRETSVRADTLDVGRAAMTTGFAAMALGVPVAGWWLLQEVRDNRRNPGKRLPPPTMKEANMEERLHLLRITSLYVESIRRSLLVTAAAIAVLVVLAMVLALPPVLMQAWTAYAYISPWYEWTLAFFAAVPLYLGFVALVHWVVSYMRVRRELARWSEMSARFDAEAEAILAA